MGGKNKLYFGDNLKILRDYVPDPAGRDGPDPAERDPPFNSSAAGSFCVAPPFRAAHAGPKPGLTATGEESAAQIMAFADTWQWGLEPEAVHKEIVSSGSRVIVSSNGGSGTLLTVSIRTTRAAAPAMYQLCVNGKES